MRLSLKFNGIVSSILDLSTEISGSEDSFIEDNLEIEIHKPKEQSSQTDIFLEINASSIDFLKCSLE